MGPAGAHLPRRGEVPLEPLVGPSGPLQPFGPFGAKSLLWGALGKLSTKGRKLVPRPPREERGGPPKKNKGSEKKNVSN